jgi:hypothetical protein
MNRYLAGLVLLLGIGLTTAAAAQIPEKLTRKQRKGPRFEFIGGDIFNFGNISDKRDATHVFKFRNAGKRPLIITQATASCGCTVPTFSKEPIKPGDTSELKVVFHTTERSGIFNKEIYIVSNAPGNRPDYKPYIIVISGTIMPGAPFGNNMD